MRAKESVNPLRSLPSVNEVLGWGELEKIPGRPTRTALVRAIRVVLEEERAIIRKKEIIKPPARKELAVKIKAEITRGRRSSLRRVINATGVVLHTNLGRARLGREVLDDILEAALNYTNLEFSLETGERGERSDHLAELLTELTGAEAALVVNNNAGAVLLVLNAISERRETIVSRGELIEIGGSFRLPEVMARSGALLREVGTTNRTYIHDYARAIRPETALFMKAHPSNYWIGGFTAGVSRAELVALGKEKGIPVFEDLGSGLLAPVPGLSLSGEPTVSQSLSEGVDLVSFSGDKLLGGPQAGIILGKKSLMDQVRKNPLARALRIDKMTLAALAATLRIYREGAFPPVLSTLLQSPVELKKRARELARDLKGADTSKKFRMEVAADSSAAGGGSSPGANLPTFVVALRHPSHSPDELAAAFRAGAPPVIGRIRENRFLIDLRTIAPEEAGEVARVFAGISKIFSSRTS